MFSKASTASSLSVVMVLVMSEVGETSFLWDRMLITSSGRFFLKIVNQVPSRPWKLNFF
jgi:hypothetical protein